MAEEEGAATTTASTSNDNQSQQPTAKVAVAAPPYNNNNNQTTSKRKRGAAGTTAATNKKKKVAPRPASSKKKKTAVVAKKQQQQQQQQQPQSSLQQQQQQQQLVPPPPAHTLILDNGGDTVKYGWASSSTTNSDDSNNTVTIHRMPNLTARLPQQLTVLVGDQVLELQNPNNCTLQRSTERSIIVNLGNQVQVWKRILDQLGVATVVSSNSTAASAFGWTKAVNKDTNKKTNKNNTSSMIPAHACAVLLALPPHYPHHVLDAIVQVWMEEFGFARVGFCLSAVCAAAAAAVDRPLTEATTPPDTTTTSTTTTITTTTTPTACAVVVDLGWSATHIVPVYNNKPISATAIRRLPLGGRHLINLYKYHASYRQWNLMDQEFVLRDVLERTAYVSLQFRGDLRHPARPGRRPYDLEVVLPDYETTRRGTVRVPVAVQQQQQQEEERRQQQTEGGTGKQQDEDDDDDDEEDDEDFTEKDAQNEEQIDDEILDDPNAAPVAEPDNNNDDDENDDEDSDSDDENPEQLRRRLVHEREEEERRRRELEAEQQILHVSVERFCIPEILFRPSDAGLPVDWANLAQAVLQSIEACPFLYRAGLYQSIQLAGGLSQLPHIAERLERELRALAPAQYKIVRVTGPGVLGDGNHAPMEAAWKGANEMVASTASCWEWSVGRDEWEAASKRGAWKRLLLSEGGHFV